MPLVPPQLIAVRTSNFNPGVVARNTTATFDCLAGDLILVWGQSEDNATNHFVTNPPTATVVSGTVPVFTLVKDGGSGSSTATRVMLWKCDVTADATGVTVVGSMDASAPTSLGGYVAKLWRAHGGLGTVSATQTSTLSAPSGSYTTTQDASVIDWANGDWTAQDPAGGKTYRSVDGSAAVEDSLQFKTGAAALYFGHWVTTTQGAKTVGMTAPASQTWTQFEIEIKGINVSSAGVSGRGSHGVRNRKGPMSGPRWMRPRNVYLNLATGGFVDSAILTFDGTGFNDATTAFGTLDINPGGSAFSLAGDWTGNGVVDIAGVGATLSGVFAWLGQGVLDYLLTGQSLSASFDVAGSGVLDENAPAAALSGDFNATGAGTVDAFLAAVSMSGDFNWTGIGVLDSVLAAQSLIASFDVTGAGTLINQLTAASLSGDFSWSGAGVLDANAPAASLAADFNWSGVGVLDGFLAAVSMSGDFNMSGVGSLIIQSIAAAFSGDFNWSGIGVVDMVPPTATFNGTDFFWTGIGDVGAFVDSANLTFTGSFDWTGIGSVNAFLAAAAFAASFDVSGAGSVLADGGSAALASSFGASGAGTLLAVAPASALDGFFNLQGAGFLIYDLIPASLASDFVWTGIGDVFSAGVLIPGRVQRGWIRHSHPTIDRIHGKVARR